MPLFAPTADDTPGARGRLHALEAEAVRGFTLHLSHRKRRANRLAAASKGGGSDGEAAGRARRAGKALRAAATIWVGHATSYDKVARPPFKGSGAPPSSQPWPNDDEHTFKLRTRFDRDHFLPHVIGNLRLLPDPISVGNPGHSMKVPLALAIYVVCRRHTISDTWDAIETEMQIPRSTVCGVYTSTVTQIKGMYGIVVGNLDFARVVPQLEDWAATVHARREGMDKGLGTRNALYAVDGKAWQWMRPGEGQAAWDLAMKAAVAQGQPLSVNLVQRAYYNGNYGFHGAKANHLFQFDGMIHATMASVRAHGSKCFKDSALYDQLHALHLPNGDPIKCLADAAYGITTHIVSTKTRAQLNALGPAARLAASAIAVADNPLRTTSEHTFNKVMVNNALSGSKRKFSLFRNGRCAWKYTSSIWEVQVLLANIHTCLYGSQLELATGIQPPTVAEYLHSANNGLYNHVG